MATRIAMVAAATAWMLSSSAAAEPFEIVVEALLNASSDFHDLDGASLRVVYAADTTDVATSSTNFDVFDMRLDITNRPNGAPDAVGLVTTNDANVRNHFPPLTSNDDIVFDSRSFSGPALPAGGVLVDLFLIDFGSQGFFGGFALVSDLSFFATLFGSSLVPGPFGKLTAGLFNDDYAFVGTQVTVPEPHAPIAGVVASGVLAFLRRRRS